MPLAATLNRLVVPSYQGIYDFSAPPREIERMLGLSELRETKVYQEALQEGEQIGEERGETRGVLKGRQQEAQALILRQMTRRIREVTPELRSQVQALSLTQLESLGEALLDFSEPADLANWLQKN
jgi:predicted transposase YdaD